jgi:hypothetical protein
MKSQARQYTIRNVPPAVDRVLRERVRTSAKSFNQVALEALIAGTDGRSLPRRDLSGIAGSLTKREAAQQEAEIQRQRQIDPALWR